MAVTSTHGELQPALRPTEAVPSVRAADGPGAVALPAAGAELALSTAVGGLLIPAGGPLPPARRLVVLVPDADVDEAALAARIWSLAAPRQLAVLFLGTARQAAEEFRARRRLALIAALTRDRTLRVDSLLAFGARWLEAVRTVHEPGDLIVCHSELVETKRFRPMPLAPALLAAVKAPIYVVAGFYPDLGPERPAWLAQLATWLPPLGLLVAFFALQARLARSSDWAQTALLYLSIAVEFVLILAWEHFLGNFQ